MIDDVTLWSKLELLWILFLYGRTLKGLGLRTYGIVLDYTSLAVTVFMSYGGDTGILIVDSSYS